MRLIRRPTDAGGAQHYGAEIILRDGRSSVLDHGVGRDAAGQLCFAESTWSAFAKGRPVTVEKTVTMPEQEFARRMQKVITRHKQLRDAGQPAYHLLTDNCENVATALVDGWYVSWQVLIGLGLVVLVCAAVVCGRKSPKPTVAA